MKSFFIAPLLLISVMSWGKEYRNTDTRYTKIRYSFRLVLKLNNHAGVFTPTYNRTDYTSRVRGNALSSRGGGGGKTILEPHYSNGEENHDIIIVGYNLTNLADGNVIELKNDQVLYQIGTYTTRRGQTLAVYSRNKRDRVEQYLRSPEITPSTGASTIRCPHCSGEIRLTPSKP